MTARGVVIAAIVTAVVAGAAGGLAGWLGAGIVVLVVMTVTAAALALMALRRPAPLARRPRPDKPGMDPALYSLDHAAGVVAMARQGPRWADTSLRPPLRRIAEQLLLARHGQGLEDNPQGSRRVLGDELFEFLDPSRPTRGHDEGTPLTSDAISRMLSRLEGLT